MVRLRSQHTRFISSESLPFFLAVLLLSFFSLLSPVLLPPSEPHLASFVIFRRKVRQDRKVRCAEKERRRKVERDPFVSFWLSCPQSLFSISLLSSHHRGPRYIYIRWWYIYKRCRTLRFRRSFSAISAHRGKMHREKTECGLTGKNRTIRMRPRFRGFLPPPVSLLSLFPC